MCLSSCRRCCCEKQFCLAEIHLVKAARRNFDKWVQSYAEEDWTLTRGYKGQVLLQYHMWCSACIFWEPNSFSNFNHQVKDRRKWRKHNKHTMTEVAKALKHIIYMVPQGSQKIKGSPDENEDLPNGFLIWNCKTAPLQDRPNRSVAAVLQCRCCLEMHAHTHTQTYLYYID